MAWVAEIGMRMAGYEWQGLEASMAGSDVRVTG